MRITDEIMRITDKIEARLRAEVERNTAPFRTPAIAGQCERLRNGADAIDSDGTPAQARPYPDELREIADTLKRQAAEIETLRDALEEADRLLVAFTGEGTISVKLSD